MAPHREAARINSQGFGYCSFLSTRHIFVSKVPIFYLRSSPLTFRCFRPLSSAGCPPASASNKPAKYTFLHQNSLGMGSLFCDCLSYKLVVYIKSQSHHVIQNYDPCTLYIINVCHIISLNLYDFHNAQRRAVRFSTFPGHFTQIQPTNEA